MGVELLVAATVLSAAAGMSSARKQAKAQMQQAEGEAQNKRQEVMQRQSALKTSFLSSGFTLDGTPSSVFEQVARIGQKDVNSILSNSVTAAKNTVGAARAEAITSMATTGATLYGMGAFDAKPKITATGGQSAGRGTQSYPKYKIGGAM